MKFIRQEHETIVQAKKSFIKLKPRNFCKIINPVVRDDKNQVVYDKFEGIEDENQT
jgi:hypothetical protein